VIEIHEFAGEHPDVALTAIFLPAEPDHVACVARGKPTEGMVECKIERAGQTGIRSFRLYAALKRCSQWEASPLPVWTLPRRISTIVPNA
jgi:hypothetical protein